MMQARLDGLQRIDILADVAQVLITPSIIYTWPVAQQAASEGHKNSRWLCCSFPFKNFKNTSN